MQQMGERLHRQVPVVRAGILLTCFFSAPLQFSALDREHHFYFLHS